MPIIIDKAHRKERRCPNEKFAREYAKKLNPYYSNIMVIERKGQWIVSFDE